jgi:hypothetical protein
MAVRAERVEPRAGAAQVRAMDSLDHMTVNVLVDMSANAPIDVSEITCRIIEPSAPPELIYDRFYLPLPGRIEPGRPFNFRGGLTVRKPAAALVPPVTVTCGYVATSPSGLQFTGGETVQIPSDFFVRTGGTCVPSDTAACLGDGRFEFTATLIDFSGRELIARMLTSAARPNVVEFFLDNPRQIEGSMSVTGCGPGSPPGATFDVAFRQNTPYRLRTQMRRISNRRTYDSPWHMRCDEKEEQ